MGTLIAWVLVRDRFRGKRVLEFVIDIPFALPTIVAGLVLLASTAPTARSASTCSAPAAAIVSRCCSSRCRSSSAPCSRCSRRWTPSPNRPRPPSAPARGRPSGGSSCRCSCPRSRSGAALAFARAMGEYGSVLLISGGRADTTEVASLYIYPADRELRLRRRRGHRHRAAARQPASSSSCSTSCSDGRPAVASTVAATAARSGRMRHRAVRRRAGAGAAVSSSPGARSQQGWSAFWNAITAPDAVTAFRLTVRDRDRGRRDQHRVRRRRRAAAGPVPVPGRRLLGPLIDLPVSVSPIVVGLALVLVYGPLSGWFGKGLASAGIQVIYALPGMILATAFVSLPLVLREVVPVLEEEGIDQEQAAQVARRQRAAALPADHAADHPLGTRLRRRAQPGPVHRRVRRGQGRVRQRQRRRPDPDAAAAGRRAQRAVRAGRLSAVRSS